MSREDKFLQPVSAIRIVKKVKKNRSLLPEEIINIGRERIAAGEDIKEVVQDLAQLEASLLPME